jgi:MmyB-like transcription regulator ligand binding domain
MGSVSYLGEVSDSQVLHRLVKTARSRRGVLAAWRAARKLGYGPREVSALVPPRGSSAGGEELTQRAMGLLLGYETQTYGRWERGAVAFPPEVVPAVPVILDMSSCETDQFYRLTLGAESPRGAAAADPARVPECWHRFVANLPGPAHVFSCEWDLVIFNKKLGDLFPFAVPGAPRPENNIMRLILREESKSIFLNRERDWLLPVFQGVWHNYRLHPTSLTLQSLVADVANSPTLRDLLWDEREVDPSTSPDTSVRQLVHPDPEIGLVTVQMIVAAPDSLRAEGYRWAYFQYV